VFLGERWVLKASLPTGNHTAEILQKPSKDIKLPYRLGIPFYPLGSYYNSYKAN
jgi:hypothetical protein